MTEMSPGPGPEKESKSNAPPTALAKDEEKGVANAAGKDEQSELRKYKWLAALFMSVALVSIFANAGLTIAIVTKAFGTQTQKHMYAVSLTSAGESAVAKVPCVEVAEAIVSIQNGDADQGLVMIPLGNGEFSTPSMSATHYQVHEDSFGMEQIFLSGDRDVSYNVSCATSMAACETHPGLLCDVLPSAATASSPEALSFEDAFDGDARRRLSHAPGVVGIKTAQTCDDILTNHGCEDHCPSCPACSLSSYGDWRDTCLKLPTIGGWPTISLTNPLARRGMTDWYCTGTQ